MSYGRSFEMLCIGLNTYFKLDKCRGPQIMPRVCRAAWVVVEVVEPLWVAWTPCKFVENVADQWM
jgi:hypothetical protein